MPNKKYHIKIDEEVLKPLRFIPRSFDTAWIHSCMDEGTENIGGKWHRLIDKWHEPRFIVTIGKNTKRIPLSKDEYKNANYAYKVAKIHLIVDEIYSRLKSKKNVDEKEVQQKIKRFLRKILKDKRMLRRHFRL